MVKANGILASKFCLIAYRAPESSFLMPYHVSHKGLELHFVVFASYEEQPAWPPDWFRRPIQLVAVFQKRYGLVSRTRQIPPDIHQLVLLLLLSVPLCSLWSRQQLSFVWRC
jgi:hypothetical protein